MVIVIKDISLKLMFNIMKINSLPFMPEKMKIEKDKNNMLYI